jgi:hypothetical protein
MINPELFIDNKIHTFMHIIDTPLNMFNKNIITKLIHIFLILPISFIIALSYLLCFMVITMLIMLYNHLTIN